MSYQTAPHGYKQDMPPPGGYANVRYKRNLPVRGPSGAMMFAGVFAFSAYGFWRVGLGRGEKRELDREAAWSRIYLTPILLAEQDRDVHRREVAAQEREARIMKDVPGWDATKGVYHTKRYTPATIAVL